MLERGGYSPNQEPSRRTPLRHFGTPPDYPLPQPVGQELRRHHQSILVVPTELPITQPIKEVIVASTSQRKIRGVEAETAKILPKNDIVFRGVSSTESELKVPTIAAKSKADSAFEEMHEVVPVDLHGKVIIAMDTLTMPFITIPQGVRPVYRGQPGTIEKVHENLEEMTKAAVDSGSSHFPYLITTVTHGIYGEQGKDTGVISSATGRVDIKTEGLKHIVNGGFNEYIDRTRAMNFDVKTISGGVDALALSQMGITRKSEEELLRSREWRLARGIPDRWVIKALLLREVQAAAV